MTKVTDKILAEYVKFQHDMLERVLKGSINPIELMNAQRSLIGQRVSPYLRLISGGKTVSISACNGGKTANLAHAQRTFPEWVDPDFKNYGINLPQPSTEKINVEIHEMYNEDADFKTLFGSLSSNLKSLAFESQEQIEKFVQENEQWLQKYGYENFFLFNEEVNGEEKFFVARVDFGSGGLYVYVDRLSSDSVWDASNELRLVVPATKPLEAKN